jgi:hypothetical protein
VFNECGERNETNHFQPPYTYTYTYTYTLTLPWSRDVGKDSRIVRSTHL